MCFFFQTNVDDEMSGEFGDNISVSSKRKSIVIDEGNVRSISYFSDYVFCFNSFSLFIYFFLWNFNLNK